MGPFSSASIIRHATILVLFFSRITIVASSTGLSRNPFTNERTGVSGFGARKRTIFPKLPTNTTGELSKEEGDEESISAIDTGSNLTLLTDAPRLWVKKSKISDAIWLKVWENKISTTLRLAVAEDSGDWVAEETEEGEEMDSDWVPIEGLYGIHKVPSGILFVLVSKTEPVYEAPKLQGEQSWWKVRRVSNFELIHLSHPGKLLTSSHLKEEVRQIRLLRKSLKQHEFFFVPDGSGIVNDMTQNLQVTLQQHLDSGEKGSWWQSSDSRPDPRFFWNQAAAESFLQRYDNADEGSSQKSLAATLLHHIVPLTSAFIGIQSNLTVGDGTNMTYQEIIISRRSRFRAGTRFTRRGADASGAVANFAETEQICLILDKSNTPQQVMSHIQTRGSVPLRWSSPTDMKTYRPRVRIGMDPLAQARALRLHLLEQQAYYVPSNESNSGKTMSSAQIVFVNLIDKHSDQGRLGRAFDSVLKAVTEVHSGNTTASTKTKKPKSKKSSSRDSKSAKNQGPSSVEHVWFDFHAETKGGKWDRLGVLLKQVQPALDEHGYFLAEAPTADNVGWDIKRKQNAIVRTNCMDSLDRTNVAQSIFGRYMLFQQLSDAASHSIDEKMAQKTWTDYAKKFRKRQLTLPWSDGETGHRLLWADNADAISRLYAGTPALKGDFTRTGKRTKRGALDDGMNSLQRYYLNNFMDADRQEGMDLMVGYANFSNVEFLDEDNGYGDEDGASSSSQEDDEKTLLSIQEAARTTFFGNIMDGLSSQHQNDLEQRLGEIGVREGTRRKSLDLLWLPGDLQCHMISQADIVKSENKRKPKSIYKFSSAEAMEAIDRRAASDLPWWVIVESSDDDDDDDDDEKEDEHEEESEPSQLSILMPHQQHPHITSFTLMGILIVAIKAPMTLAATVVGLVGLVFLPAVISHDLK